MRNKIKFITTICATMLLAFSLTGCGGDEIEINSWDNKDVTPNSAITYNPDESEDVTVEKNSTTEGTETTESVDAEENEGGSMFKFGSTNSDGEVDENSTEGVDDAVAEGENSVEENSANDVNQDVEVDE